jgi:diphosphomevalonate decarboxylase
MSLSKQNAVALILGARAKNHPVQSQAEAYAPVNIALCKYWGKRDEVLNLPVTSSLSISLGPKGSLVRLSAGLGVSDSVFLNDQALSPESPFARRVSEFLDLFRPEPSLRFRVAARNNIPTAAGFASSASGFAAMVLALDRLFAWGLEPRELSILARLGSGSACRSVFDGFVQWNAGERADGMDSFAEPIAAVWKELRIGLVMVSRETKSVSSRAGMKHTQETSPLYAAWPGKVAQDLNSLQRAIAQRDFELLGQTAEANALAMHATMIAAWPPLMYWRPESLEAMLRVQQLRERRVPVYFTMDAGPNLKLLFRDQDEEAVRSSFPDMETIAPFDR